ncbi:MAG: tetratricopeptide repeat protein [Pyrinomonadaceae bacterium]
MKKKKEIVLLLAGATALLSIVVFGIRSSSSPAMQAEDASTQPVTEQKTPADLRIRAGENQIKLRPDKPEGYNLLASAWMQKARETGDFGFNARADEALNNSLRVEPDNYDALKLRAKLLLTYHRFREGLDLARRAQSIRPTDHDVYGALTDAYVELGEYPAAIDAAQKMVDLRPDSSSYARVAYLRSLHGDTEGAIAAMQVAVKSSNPKDPEAAAWTRVHLGLELAQAGKLAEAEREFDKALLTFPNHKLALDAKARSRIAAGDLNAAIQIYEAEQKATPSADVALALGDLYAQTGRQAEAGKQYESFESLERENVIVENSWHHMINYWLDNDKSLVLALEHAQREYESRKDIFTCDTLAWALFKNGRLPQAQQLMKEALRTGSRNARLLYHSGMIANALGDRRSAARDLQLALKLNLKFDLRPAEIARNTLASLSASRPEQTTRARRA